MSLHIKPISIECTKIIIKQMKNSLYSIKTPDEKIGMGLFCYIQCHNKKVPVLITNNHIINEECDETLKILINKNYKDLQLGNSRYKNKEYDLAVLEIKENKNDNLFFLELDSLLYKDDSEMYYDKDQLYIIHYNAKNNIFVSYGFLNDFANNKIYHNCDVNENSHLSPIFNLSNNKLIGIHNNFLTNNISGIYLKYMINKFINTYEYTNKFITDNKYKFHHNLYNEIDILIKLIDIKEKETYFLDNYEYKDKTGKKHFHDNLKELNASNTELYINNKKHEYQKYFIPGKEMEYNIKLRFSVNLTDCSYMFAGCENIMEIKFKSFNTKNVTNMKYMFHRCKYIKDINLFYFNTKNVNDMSGMFSFCENLKSLDLASFNTKHVQNMSYMFYNCHHLKYLNVSSFHINNTTNIDYMYELCDNIILSPLNNKNKEGINQFENEIIIKFNIDRSLVNQKMYYLDNFPYKDKEGKQHSHDNLKELNALNTEIYRNDKKEEFETGKFFIPREKGEYIIKIKIKTNLTDCSFMFAGCNHITSIDFKNFNTKYITNMKYMFADCKSLRNIINLSSFDTQNVTNMNWMFYNCSNLKNLDLSNFNTKNVIDMRSMFSDCKSLTSLNLLFFNTSNVTNMSFMFAWCEQLKSLNVSSFNTKNVTDMSSMFSGCENLNNLNLSNFDIQNVTNISNIFYNCQKTIIDSNKSKFEKFDYYSLF